MLLRLPHNAKYAVAVKARIKKERGSASDKEAHVYASANDIDCDVCGRIKGDLNGDNVLDVRDVTALLSYLTDKNSTALTSSGDLTDDGKVTVKDVSRLLRYLAAK